MSFLDLVLVVILAGYALSGLRQGFVASVLSLAGFLGGAALAMWLLPGIVDHWALLADSPVLRAGVLVAAVVVVAVAGQSAGVALAHRLRGLTRLPVARTVDGVAGMVVVTVAASILIWFVAGALRVGGPEPVSRAIARSAVLRVIDNTMPDDTSRWFASFRQVLDREGFPRVFEGIQAEPIAPVAPPSSAVAKTPAIAKAAAVRSSRSPASPSSAARCRRARASSCRPGRVVTNAHVVAGLRNVEIQVSGVPPVLTGRVVVFDPRRDLAVVDVPGLKAPVLSLGSQLQRADDAVVAGFPGGGGYTVRAVRVRSEMSANGSDIYGQTGTVRQIYSLNGVVQPGNSGGPLLGPTGLVEGVVFARSLDDPHTGYALTLDELRPVLAKAAGTNQAVSTGACVLG